MSTVEANPDVEPAPGTTADAAARPAATAGPGGEPELTQARVARVADMEVRRLMPLRRRRSVGAWCFVDHYGPMSVDGVAGMQVPPHPHIGLQTVTWLLDGNVLHRDSLGSEQMIRPGQLNLMTSGRGIAHSEESPEDHDPRLHGVQLWLALPEDSHGRPAGSSTTRNCRRPGWPGSRSPSSPGNSPDCARRPRSSPRWWAPSCGRPGTPGAG